MSTKNVKSLPYHKEVRSASNENQMNMRHMSNRILPINFPPTKTMLWDSTPMGDVIGLHFSYYRNPRLLLSEKALRLSYRHAKAERRVFHCFLLGSFSVDDDEEGVTLTIDRFDPGRAKNVGAGKVPSAVLPGDVVIPCTISIRESSGNVTLHTPEEFAASFKGLQSHLYGKETLDLSKLLAVRAHITYSENMDNLHFDLHWAAVTVANTFESPPIKPVPIIPTALARNLSSHHNIAQLQGTHKWGYLTMDQTRKLLLILESEPKAYTLPLVGIWLSGITHIHSPQVWASCLRYLFSTSIKERVLSESGSFLIVLYSLTHKEPEFYECVPAFGLDPLSFQLLTCEDSLHLFKNVDPSKQSHLQFELTPECHSPDAYLLTEVSKTVSTALPKQKVSPSKLSVSDHDSGVEDEDFSPRPSPRPHPSFQQVTKIHPSVPELSMVFGSAVEPKPSMKNSGNGNKVLPLSSTPKVVNPFVITSYSHSMESLPTPSSTPAKTIKPQAMKQCSQVKSSAGDKPSSHVHPSGQTRRNSASSSTSSSSLSTPRTGSSPDTSVHQVRGSSELELRCNMNGPCKEQPPFSSTPYSRPSSLPQSPNHNVTFPLQARPLCEASKPTQGFASCRHQSSICNCCNTTGPAQCNSPASWPAGSPIGHRSQEIPSVTAGSVAPFYQNTSCPNACCSPILMNASRTGGCASPAHGTNPSAGRDSLSITPCSTTTPCMHIAPQTVPGPSTMFGLSAEAYQLLAEQDKQLKLLQTQIQRLLEAQASQANSKHTCSEKTAVASETQTSESALKSCVSIAVSTGASLFWNPPPCPEEEGPLDKQDESELCNGLSVAVNNEQDASSTTIASSLKAVDIYSFAESSQLTDCGGHSPPSPRPVRGEVSPLHHRSQLSTGASLSDAYPECPGNPQTPDLGAAVPALPPEKFYHDLLNQVNHLLKTSSSDSNEASEDHSRAGCLAGKSLGDEYSSQDTRQSDVDSVHKATLKQLKSLGVEVTADTSTAKLNGSDTADNACVLAYINPEAVIPRLNYMSLSSIGLSGFVSNGVDLSMEANAIALKYLSESQLSQLSLSHTYQNKALDSSSSSSFHALFPGNSEKSMVGLSIISPNNMSFATKKYLKRYALIESHDSSDDDSDPPPNSGLFSSEQSDKSRLDYSDHSELDPSVKTAVEFIKHTEVNTLRNITNEMPKKTLPVLQTSNESSLNVLKEFNPKPKVMAEQAPFTRHHDKENERNTPFFNVKDFTSSRKKVSASSLEEVLDVNHLRQLPKLF